MTRCTVGVMVAPPGLEDVAALRAAVAGQGVTGLWWPDHWMGWGPSAAWDEAGALARSWPSPDLYSDPFVEMAVYGRETQAPILGTCVTDVVRRHPVGVVQSIETVLRLAPSSNVVLGLGAGERENLEPYGLPPARVARVEEFIEIVHQAVTSGSVEFEGEHFRLDQAPVPAPLSRERLKIWVGAHGPRMLDLTARLADGWLPMGFPASLVAKRRPRLDKARPAGLAPLASSACIVTAVVENDDQRDAVLESAAMKRLALFSGSSIFEAAGHEHPFGTGFNPLSTYVPSRLSAQEVRDAVAKVPAEVISRVVRLLDPEELPGLIEQYADAGAEHLVVWDVLHLVAPGTRGRTIELLCDAAQPDQ